MLNLVLSLAQYRFSISIIVSLLMRRRAVKFKKEDLIKLYVNMVRAEAYDQWLTRKSLTGEMKATYHPVWGDYAAGVAGCTFLKPDDVIYPHHRGHGLPHLIGKGVEIRRYIADQFGKATGSCNGFGTMAHQNYPEMGVFGTSGTLGASFVLSAGWGLAAQMNGRGQVVICFFGDGTVNRGTWHEGANVAALWKLPVVYVCENNGIASYVPVEDSYALEDLANLASAYGIPAVVVDGQDVIAVAEAVTVAVERAREGKGPSFIECKTIRTGPHATVFVDKVHGQPRDPQKLEEMKKRDPVVSYRNRLLEQGVLTPADVERVAKEAVEELAETERFVNESPILDDPSALDGALYAE
jgi:TPP-dependent pyruvate/acetoin dehydrogenase alpha subunit